MAGLGSLLFILGIGSVLLPMIGFQFRLMEWADKYQPIGGIVVAAVGLALIVVAQRMKPAADAATPAPASSTATADAAATPPPAA